MGFIYTLTSPSKKKYIGQTTRSIDQRFDNHQKKSSRCKAISGAIQKYGWDNFVVDYYECPDEELNKHERWLVELMGTLAPGGYNLREGGGCCGKLSEETKQKMSESRAGEKHWNYGGTLSQTHKVAISAAMSCEKNSMFGRSGEKHPMFGRSGEKHHNSKRVYQYTLDGVYVHWFGSTGEAARALEKNDGGNIAACARGDRPTAYDFKWSYEFI
ncbi:GIY-YIG catalytic domain-containing endonuclease [Paramecium bursaria Chlorella virus NY2B]|uniref:Uncharacterized protein B602L n=1 Tax=Paramecium bursaria Chlorella virus NY2A TaxID=46021 RepID=A7IXC7_PBCVN|nr:hypothetical protein NY2A_B602L [Paramecium bursaria Chlorella virus NY2A]YP_001498628.1 hypothetical protein AR158_C547L [Paramecium bursaria Chlorella virus AR158]ABT15001.1 hypothetical protein NY2A_B602L [Paramecium bursaria Chlorella virus NY2A]ABU44092.1 hypothetical protein AR158_C547L [Paramecium bursaria Chlorella virus AR158]AGE58433.1 GIY-YIG catalytic domain-containing endonuclease [Paramecium bursaria Chlorella virus NY2B]